MKLKIGVLGVGRLGKIHLKCLKTIPAYEVTGFYDPDPGTAREVVEEFEIPAFSDYQSLIESCDAVDIVAPTTAHFELAAYAVRAGKHVFIEKPLTHTLTEAEELIDLVRKNQVKVQVGHVERFNPAFLALEGIPLAPMFVEAHRLSNFNPRGTDVSVILDLMIHDIDVLLHLVPFDVKEIHASGVAVVSDSADVANARIEFVNGCVANLTASRLSLKQMRKIRLFQRDAYISMDFLEKTTQIIRLHDKTEDVRVDHSKFMELETPRGVKMLEINTPESVPVNAIQRELETFAEAILFNRPIPVTIGEGYRALKIAHQIIETIDQQR